MKNKLNYKYETLTPFKICVLENFPFIEADFDALTNYQIMSKIVEYLNQTRNNQNIVQENITELNNWFNNLDVTNEINAKLDEMANDGTLAEIIEDYATIPQLTERVTNVENDVEKLNLGITNEEIIIVGDSYLAGQSLASPSTQNYGYLLMQKLGMNPNNFHIWAEGGSSFTNPGNQDRTWLQIVQARISEVNPNNITKLIFAGGYNDIVASNPSNIRSAMQNTINTCKSLFPNAKIYVDLIGNNGATTSNGSNARNLLKNRIYNIYSRCYNYGAIFIDKGQLAIQDYSLYENNETAVHPNADGHIAIANYLYQALQFGTCDYVISIDAYNGNTPTDFTGSLIFAEKLVNNKVQLGFYTADLVGTITQGENNINLGVQPLRLIRHNAVATGNDSEMGFIRIGNNITNVYHRVPAKFYVNSNNELRLLFENNYENINKIISQWSQFEFDVSRI